MRSIRVAARRASGGASGMAHVRPVQGHRVWHPAQRERGPRGQAEVRVDDVERACRSGGAARAPRADRCCSPGGNSNSSTSTSGDAAQRRDLVADEAAAARIGRARTPCSRSRSARTAATIPARRIWNHRLAVSPPAPPPRERPIAVFDSGVGGLTVLQELLVELPHEDFLYLGDTARFPYGERSAAELERFALEIAELPARAPREAARRRLQRGELGGARRCASGCSRRRLASTVHRRHRAGVAARRGARRATAGSACSRRRRPCASGAYDARSLHASTPDATLTSVACPDLAPMIQEGFPFDRRVVEAVRELLRAAARGGRRHGDPRLHALPAHRADAPAHPRPAASAWSARAARWRCRSPPSLELAGLCQRRRAARATTASCAPATSRPSASSARASCSCRSSRSSTSS